MSDNLCCKLHGAHYKKYFAVWLSILRKEIPHILLFLFGRIRREETVCKIKYSFLSLPSWHTSEKTIKMTNMQIVEFRHFQKVLVWKRQILVGNKNSSLIYWFKIYSNILSSFVHTKSFITTKYRSLSSELFQL